MASSSRARADRGREPSGARNDLRSSCRRGDARRRPEARCREGHPAWQGERILLVEDEPALPTLATDMLEYLGYAVLTATNSAEALKMKMEHEGEIDLVLSDLVMPELGGVELTEMLSRSSPHLPIVLMSGHPMRGEHHAAKISAWAKFMQKPFTIDTFAASLQKSLAQNAMRPDETLTA